MNRRTILTAKLPETKKNNIVSHTRKTDSTRSTGSPIDNILFLQRTIGNQAVLKMFKSGVIQAKLRIGQPNDIYEQEADRVAEQVMRMTDVGVAQRSVEPGRIQTLQIQRMCPACEKDLQRQSGEEGGGELLQDKESQGQTQEVTFDIESSINSLQGGGQPLPASALAFIEPRFGYDFSQVRVHADERAAESARAVNALAYTVGKDVVFGTGQYGLSSPNSRRLLAHELVHVLQQKQSANHTLTAEAVNSEGSLYERGGYAGAIALSGRSEVLTIHGTKTQLVQRVGFGDVHVAEAEMERDPVWGGFRIRGNEAYIRAVRADLDQINATANGSALLSEIKEYTSPFYRSLISIESSGACGFLPTGISYNASGCSVPNN